MAGPRGPGLDQARPGAQSGATPCDGKAPWPSTEVQIAPEVAMLAINYCNMGEHLVTRNFTYKYVNIYVYIVICDMYIYI